MLLRCLSLIVLAAACTLPSGPAVAGPLTEAEVTKIINQVSLIDPHNGERAAALRDVIKDDRALETGKKSRSELLFQDNTLTRIGAETFFSFKTGTRDLTLEKGSMLLQVPKGLGGAQIHTAAVTAAITGTTIMMEYVPKQYIKVLVLEGSLRLSRNGSFGDSLVLTPGKMVIMRPDVKKIPDPVDVDLEHIVKTSSLVNFPGSDLLPSMPLIQAAIASQQNQLVKKDLVPTNLVMGHGTNVMVASSNPLTATIGSTGALAATAKGIVSTAGNVVSTLGGTSNATTSAANNVLGSTTGAVGSVANNLLGAASTLNSVTVSTTTVDNLNSVTGSAGSVANNALAAVSGVASVPVSSSSQLLALVNTAVPSAGGVVSVIPTTVNPVTTAATAPAATSASNPIVSSVSTAAANITANTTTTLPSGSSASSPVTASASSPPVTTTITPASTTLASTALASQTSAVSTRPLGLGH
jgi:FecR protein